MLNYKEEFVSEFLIKYDKDWQLYLDDCLKHLHEGTISYLLYVDVKTVYKWIEIMRYTKFNENNISFSKPRKHNIYSLYILYNLLKDPIKITTEILKTSDIHGMVYNKNIFKDALNINYTINSQRTDKIGRYSKYATGYKQCIEFNSLKNLLSCIERETAFHGDKGIKFRCYM